jgi:hypothetical protein
MTLIPLSSLRTDGGTQGRAGLTRSIVDEYAEAMQQGAIFPPVVAYHDGTNTWLADGFHRHAAARQAGVDQIDTEVLQGTQQDARLFSCGANDRHGLRRSNEDKRHVVATLLADEEWSQASDRWIAETCKVSRPLVADVRQSGGNSATCKTSRKGKDGKTYSRPLCGRCQKGPVKKNCSMCRELRDKKPRKPRQGDAHETRKPSKNGTPHLDAFGNPVPKNRCGAWADPWLQEWYDALCELYEGYLFREAWTKYSKRREAYPFFDAAKIHRWIAQLQESCKEMIEHIKTQRPAGVCPACRGKGCSTCKGKGLVPRAVYEALKEKQEVGG